MPDIIKLLPDHVANQIAAGEVIQRPASIVKELLENSLDAKATHIKLIVKDGGKTLVQVVDDGIGMSETDARMCFERHATSKIAKAEDLFHIRTMGFRGEAMASIAAVAHVELKTRQHHSETGTHLVIEGSNVVNQEVCSTEKGTSIAVKNLFFNIPARRQFLKNDLVEMRHILDEFHRVALANPEIGFQLFNGQQEVYRLSAGPLKKRIVDLLGNSWNEKLVQVDENTSIVSIKGYIGKPESARKTRGDQYFFINNRFVKNNYLHHAIQAAFQDLIPQGHNPVYIIFFDVDPKTIDINIHPTKTEVKFEDEQSVYAVLRSAVKKSIGQFHLTPSIDFENEPAFDMPFFPKNKPVVSPDVAVNPFFNPFESSKPRSEKETKEQLNFWKANLSPNLSFENNTIDRESVTQTEFELSDSVVAQRPFLLHEQFIVSQVKSGMMLIHRTRALHRISFDHLLAERNTSKAAQRLLFPAEIQFNQTDLNVMLEIQGELTQMGFELSFSDDSVFFTAIPSEISGLAPEYVIHQLLDEYKLSGQSPEIKNDDKVVRLLSRIKAQHTPILKSEDALNFIIEKLFECKVPHTCPDGTKIVHILKLDELNNYFTTLAV